MSRFSRLWSGSSHPADTLLADKIIRPCQAAPSCCLHLCRSPLRMSWRPTTAPWNLKARMDPCKWERQAGLLRNQLLATPKPSRIHGSRCAARC